jgi:hypothetical protein
MLSKRLVAFAHATRDIEAPLAVFEGLLASWPVQAFASVLQDVLKAAVDSGFTELVALLEKHGFKQV